MVTQENIEFSRTISKNVRRQRELKGWSQMKMSQEVDCHPTYISQIERKLKPLLSAYTLYKIATALDVTMNDLISAK